MIRKLIHTFILPAVLLLSFSGCNDWLTLKPESEIVYEEFWKTESDVNDMLSGCYRNLTKDDCVYRMMVWGELRSDNIAAAGSFPSAREDMQRILDGDITSSNSYCGWSPFYRVINYCNILLKNAPKVVSLDQNFTEKDLERVQAEALAIRSLCYFYLVRTFKEVPWVNQASETDQQNYKLPKSPENEVLDSVVANLESVKDWATNDFGDEKMNKGYFTKNAIYALLADIYLWRQQYDLCISRCDKVLSDPNLELVEAQQVFSSVFSNGNSKESIFELQFNDLIQSNTPARVLYGYSEDKLGDWSFPITLVTDVVNGNLGAESPFNYTKNGLSESLDDIRARDSYTLSGGKYYIFKYAGDNREILSTGITNYNYRTISPNWIIYRLSDVILMKAEAYADKGDIPSLGKALDMVNLIYMRSNPNDGALEITKYKAKADMQKLVLRERQRELLFEGKRWFDLMRLARRDTSVTELNEYVGKKSTGTSLSKAAPVLNAMYLPISKGELEANPALKQNPYYEESGNSSTRN